MQFLNPWFLIGLIAIAIPVAVHLFNFRRYKKVYFSNVQFLRELKQETRKQSNLIHRLILACRILAFLFIVLAFAQPVFLANRNAKVNRSNIVSVFVDNSFSMESQGTRGTLLDEAKHKAAELAAAYQQDDQFQLLTNDFEGRQQQLVSRDEYLTLVNEIEASPSVRSLKEVSSRQNDLLQSSRGNAVVHYISDFQRSTILQALPDSGIAKGYIIPVVSASKNNLFIDSCWFSNPVLQINQQATLTIKITNVSDKKLEKIPVKLMIDNAQRAVASIDIDAGKSHEISLSFTNNKPGNYSGYVEINDFPVTYDDIYYFTYRISPEIPVLCIYEDKQDDYISSVYAVDSIIKLTNTSSRQIDLSSFINHRLIILDQLKNYSSGLIQELTKFVENGGSIIIIPSFETPANIINQLLLPIGTDLVNTINDSPVRISKINVNHPVYKEVFESGSLKAENLDLPSINKHFNLVSSRAGNSETLLELANGEPFLTYSSKGAGKVYFFSAALDEESGNFIRHALFVPTMLNIAFRSEKITPLMYYTDNNTPIPITGIQAGNDKPVKISATEGDFDFIPEIRKINGLDYIFTNGQVTAAGFYNVMTDDKKLELLAFNYNRKESLLEPGNTSDFDALREKTGLQLINNSQKPIDKVINGDKLQNHMWKWFVVAALLSLLAEVLLLSFFKSRTTTV
ncbi:MAG TPA: BatA domain-containing protein [Lentimicrobium sp.]|nr:BatA domain-containing protein [Lentimicrobium sp.]